MNKCFFVSIFLLFTALSLNAQQKYLTKTAHVWFESETPIERIEAHNKQATAILTDDGNLAFRILMKSFEFPKALMQEHFNENYVESEKYPMSTFEGRIVNMEGIDLKKDGKYEALVEGKLSLHGVGKTVKEKALLTISDSRINGQCSFKILLEDYKIVIPRAVEDKIEREITIHLDANFEPYNR